MGNHYMSNEDMERVKNLDLAPYIQLAVCLIDKPRMCLSNTFRHTMSTMAILLDYGYTDSILLKASIIHDIVEDIEYFDHNRILCLEEGKEVLELVLEVSKNKNEAKNDFLTRIKNTGSFNAKVLKSADRISNLHDLGFVTDKVFLKRYIEETENYVIGIAEDVNKYMVIEMRNLIISRRKILEMIKDYEREN